MNINKNEMLKLSEKNFKKEKRNYIKSIPRYIKKEEKINTNENADHNLNINYDIDGIIGIFSPNQIRKFINEQISINFTKIKPKTDTFYFIRNSLEYSIKEIEFINFGAIHLGSSYKIDVFLANLDYKIDLSVLNKIFSLYNLKIKSDCYNKLSFDKKKTVFNGLIALKNFFNLEECIKRVLDNSGIIFIEILGCKKNFNDYNVENLMEMVEKYINIKNDNFVLDFCISVLSHNSKIIYPKNDFLKNIGETPNYFQFFSYECPNVNRNKPKYKSSNKYLEDLNVIKVNFYSSTQDLFNKLSAQKYYPLLSKCLLKDIIADNTSYSSYFKQLDKYKEIQLKARAAQKLNAERIYYRFEFRLQAININELERRISEKLTPNNFTYFDKTKFLNLVENNVIFFLDFINNIEKKILNAGKIVILESLFVNSYLRGNIFLLPFTTRLLRTELKKFWKQTPYMLDKSDLDNVFSSSEHYDTLANFLKTINGINTKNKENITCFLKYRPLFNNKEIFLNEIKNLILTDQPKCDKNKKALFLENPVTFFKNNFLPSLKKSSILLNLIQTYENLYFKEDLFALFTHLKFFYFESKNKFIFFNTKITNSENFISEKERLLKFLQALPKIQKMWSKNELNEIKFIRYLYEKYNKEVSLEKIYYNTVFSFHLTRTYTSFKAKFYRMKEKETNSELIEIYDFDSRISYITKSLNLQISSKLKKIYKYVILQDLLKLGIIE